MSHTSALARADEELECDRRGRTRILTVDRCCRPSIGTDRCSVRTFRSGAPQPHRGDDLDPPKDVLWAGCPGLVGQLGGVDGAAGQTWACCRRRTRVRDRTSKRSTLRLARTINVRLTVRTPWTS